VTDPVRAAILAHGGRIVYSCEVNVEPRSHCSTCGETGHAAPRCNGPGQEPRPDVYERRRAAAAERVREVIAKHAPHGNLDEARRVIAERIAARRK